jgi:hypothetical protein
MVKNRKFIILGLLISIIILQLACSTLFSFDEQVVQLLISTDKDTYQVGETIHVNIVNYSDRTIDIYCPMNCALGNFPTTVGRFEDGGWVTLAGFCPSIEPILGDYPLKGEFIVHPLAPGDGYDLELTNLDALRGEQNLQVMYNLEGGRAAIYSSPFAVNP